MKKIIILFAAFAALASCTIEREHENEVTPRALKEYTDMAMFRWVVFPAYELGHYLFIEEYRKADASGREALNELYGLKGAVHMIDEQSFHIDHFGDIYTKGLEFGEDNWGSQWSKGEKVDEWIRADGTTASVLRTDGKITGFTLISDKGLDQQWSWYKSWYSFPEGPISVSNPVGLGIDRNAFQNNLCLEYYSATYGIEYAGVFRLDIVKLDGMNDWVIFSGSEDGINTYKTSRDCTAREK